MQMDSPFGGVLPLAPVGVGEMAHPNALALSTGRACLALIADVLKPAAVYVPFYTCNTVFQPFVERGILLKFYAIGDDFRPLYPPVLQPGEYFLWTDYFGLCGHITTQIIAQYGDRLIIDDTQSFFSGRHEGCWSFTSARKWFGVPDGAFLFAPVPLRTEAPRFEGASLQHLLLSRLGRAVAALKNEYAYEGGLTAAIHRISAAAEIRLRGIDMARMAHIRRTNFAALHGRLCRHNQLAGFLNTCGTGVPFCYPFLSDRSLPRLSMAMRGVHLSAMWFDAAARAGEGYARERMLARSLLVLPVDPRYDAADMMRLSDLILSAMSQ